MSKRRDSSYRSGRSPHWIKSKNPNAPAVKREAEEDWGRQSMPQREFADQKALVAYAEQNGHCLRELSRLGTRTFVLASRKLTHLVQVCPLKQS